MTKYIFKLLILISIFSFTDISYSQQSIDSIINFTLTFRGLTQQDITIPVNFDKDKSPTNDAKLILPVVRDLMKEPMKSFEFMNNVESIKDLNLIQILERLYKLKNVDTQFLSEILINENGTPEQFYEQIISFVKERNNIKKKLTEGLNKEDRGFLNKYLFSIIAETEEDDGVNSNIFKFNKARDSSIAVSKRTMEILSKIKIKDELNYGIHDAEYCWLIYNMIKESKIKFPGSERENNKFISGNYIFYYDRDGFRIAIGGKGKNIYNGHFDFIIDLGGDDVYNIDRETTDLFKNNFSCIIDLSGNDYYTSNSNYSLAGSVFSSGFIFDKEGDDTYKGKNISLGSAICGLGVLYDENGNDTYQANQFSIGAASFGVGVLLDRSGNDVYIANSYSQGFGMTEGAGAIVDNKGNDNYLIDARSLDIGRYEDHYISMSQGYGLGLRPYYAGGIGLIIEGEGNDFYSTDIFGQGGAYWYALGCIVDRSGHDKYNSYQYAQGAGIHLAVGLLKDSDGWDMYSSNGVSQGCGHDFGFGLLYDVRGNDNYSAYSLSQGAGNANGIGMLIDESGRDGYLNKEPGNSRGYGNSRREFGSLGIFLDASGEDFYSLGGMDSVINNNSMWGMMTDFYLQDLKSQASGNAYKVPLDSNLNYTQDEYFIMAKTIEPRFSLWQEYGFRMLAEDSINTPEYILKYLDTEDHRAGLVLRNLSQKIYYTMGNFFAEKLRLYTLSMRSMSAKSMFNPNQVAFICYLFGETRNPAGKEELLNLTYDENIRIRSASVNALGKIKIDTSETDFINRTSARLRELAAENSPYKLYKKDIAYAFKNYKNFDNIASLITLLGNDYYGVRFTTESALRSYGDEYYNLIDDVLIKDISGSTFRYISFLNSTQELSPEKFKDVITRSLDINVNPDMEIDLVYADLLKRKLKTSSDVSFNQWAEKKISEFQSNTNFRVF